MQGSSGITQGPGPETEEMGGRKERAEAGESLQEKSLWLPQLGRDTPGGASCACQGDIWKFGTFISESEVGFF